MTADASLTSVRYLIELSYAVIPFGAYKEVRQVSEDLGSDIGMVQSEEITSDRTPPDNIQTEAGGSGRHISELTGGSIATGITYDDWWMAGLNSTAFTTLQFSAVGSMSGTITPSNSGNNLVLVLSTGTWNANFTAGEFIAFAGFTGVRAVLNSVFRVVSGAGTNTLTVDSGVLAPASPGTENAALVSAALARSIVPGSVARSFSIERKYSLANNYAIQAGAVLQGFDIEMRPKRPLRVTWIWLTRGETSFAFPHSASSEVCTVTAHATTPGTGNWTFTVDGQTTANIAANATATAIQTAIEALSTVGAGNVSVAVTGGANLGVAGAVATITFISNKGGQNLTTSASFAGMSGNPHVFAVATEGGTDLTVPAVTAQRVFSAVSDMKLFALNKNGTSYTLNSLTLRFRNGAYAQDEQAGTLGPVNIGQGSFSLEGSMEFYYSGKTLFDIAQAFTDTELAFAVSNSSGSAWGMHIPRLNFSNPRRGTPGKDQAVKGSMDFKAAKGPAYLAKLFVL